MTKSLDTKLTGLEQQQPVTGAMILLAGLWEHEDSDGEGGVYWSGFLSPVCKIIVWPNRVKKKASDPDYAVYLAPPSDPQALESIPIIDERLESFPIIPDDNEQVAKRPGL